MFYWLLNRSHSFTFTCLRVHPMDGMIFNNLGTLTGFCEHENVPLTFKKIVFR